MRHAPAHSRSARSARAAESAQSAKSAQALAAREPYSPRTFAQATNIADIVAERRRLKRSLMIMRAFIILLVTAALIVGGFPVVWQFQSAAQLAGTSGQAASQVAGWPYPRAKEALVAARAYNKRLAKSGQPVLGEAIDPFSAHEGASQAKGEDSAASKDKEYQSLLNADHEIMGAIRIPKISVDLPIWHGTSEEALASGAGHLYGTSLPVGGQSTHSVITGHRGLVSAMMFTRLDEMQVGDFFYIEVMGETLGYEVDRISVIEPDDTSQLRIVPGEDRITLMTCTPYGVNTQRLLVSGHREPIPVPAPDPNDLYDAKTLTILTVVIGVVGGWLMVAVVRRVRYMPWRVMRHAHSAPRRP
ncbi:sortase [Bifidobacterium goeldii]|uniref:Sortase n=1 Tax=Bifidobacterium goeldii TaxID=2306975 RepID=A0A430FDR9_9BIFI|nr:class C sortase [Bifidobacterium goeldii]RSX50986.1 sortase [Bifidobacterium goeldii]